MPPTAAGKKIIENMMKQYHSEKKAKQVFYSMENVGKLPKSAIKETKKRRRRNRRRKRR